MSISKSAFFAFVQEAFVPEWNGSYFLTKTGKEYHVQLTDGVVCFTPQSTGEERVLSDREIEKGIDRFNRTGSLMPKDYRDFGVNASYYLPIFEQVRDAGRETTASEGIDARGDEAPGRIEARTVRIIRDTVLAKRVKEEHDHTCQICEIRIELTGGEAYAEAHHVVPLKEDGPDVKENIMCVCPNHHAMLDYKALRLNPEKTVGVAKAYVQWHNRQVAITKRKAV